MASDFLTDAPGDKATRDCVPPEGETLFFSGYEWGIKNGRTGPGPNAWAKENVCVDSKGQLHLKITSIDGIWHCAEIFSLERFGFGTYQFEISARLDSLDPHVVVGLFTYPTADVGPDETREIDMEFGRWSSRETPYASYVVWPREHGKPYLYRGFEEPLYGTATTHRFIRAADHVLFRSFHGFRDDEAAAFESGPHLVSDPSYVPQRPLPVHLNLWLHQGKAPSDGREVEIVIKRFTFTPAPPAPV